MAGCAACAVGSRLFGTLPPAARRTADGSDRPTLLYMHFLDLSGVDGVRRRRREVGNDVGSHTFGRMPFHFRVRSGHRPLRHGRAADGRTVQRTLVPVPAGKPWVVSRSQQSPILRGASEDPLTSGWRDSLRHACRRFTSGSLHFAGGMGAGFPQ